MNLIIREGEKKDIPEVLNLIKQLADYEKALDQVTITEKELENDGFKDHPYYSFLIAEKDQEIIGLSFFFIRYSTWKGKFLFLEDFVIKKEYRKQGIGTALFNKTIETCHKLKLNGMCWQVLDWNTPAINFYKKYDSEISSKWLNGKLTKSQINSICLANK